MKKILRFLLSLFLIFAGVSHLLSPDFFLPMMPAYLPWPTGLIFISGVLEIVLGVMVFFRRYRRLAGIGITLLLIAVFPANIHMAFHPEVFPSVSLTVRWARLPLQAILILWALWVTKCEKENDEEH